MMTTTTTTTITTTTTCRRRRLPRRSQVARRAMSSSVDRTRQHDDEHQHHERFDEASSSSSSGVHVVSPGDSLYGVAVYYGVDPRDLIVRRRDFLPFVVGLFSSSRRLRAGLFLSANFEFKRNQYATTRCGRNSPPVKMCHSRLRIITTGSEREDARRVRVRVTRTTTGDTRENVEWRRTTETTPIEQRPRDERRSAAELGFGRRRATTTTTTKTTSL